MEGSPLGHMPFTTLNAMLGKTFNDHHDYSAKINEERGRKSQKPCRESLCVCSFPGMRQDYTLEHVPFLYSFPVRPKRSSATSSKSAKKENCFSLTSSKFVGRNLFFFVFLREVFLHTCSEKQTWSHKCHGVSDKNRSCYRSDLIYYKAIVL